jgi:hypothetical protein
MTNTRQASTAALSRYGGLRGPAGHTRLRTASCARDRHPFRFQLHVRTSDRATDASNRRTGDSGNNSTWPSLPVKAEPRPDQYPTMVHYTRAFDSGPFFFRTAGSPEHRRQSLDRYMAALRGAFVSTHQRSAFQIDAMLGLATTPAIYGLCWEPTPARLRLIKPRLLRAIQSIKRMTERRSRQTECGMGNISCHSSC